MSGTSGWTSCGTTPIRLRDAEGAGGRRVHAAPVAADAASRSRFRTTRWALDSTPPCSCPCLPTRARRRRVSLDRLARLAGMMRPDIRRDPVHFRLIGGRG